MKLHYPGKSIKETTNKIMLQKQGWATSNSRYLLHQIDVLKARIKHVCIKLVLF